MGLLVLLVLSIQVSFSKTFDEYAMESNIKFPFTEDNTPYSEVTTYKFKKLLEQWEQKKIQEKQIADYEKYGISKSLATRAVNERLRSARAVVKDNKFDDRNISPILDGLDNRVATLDNIAILGHERFKKLVKKYEMEVDDGFYQCLCRTKGIAGTGLGYSPAPDKHCNTSNPCKGGNWGCVSSDFPQKGDSWITCAQKYRLKNGGNIFQAFDEHINARSKFVHDDLVRKLFDRSLKFKKLCLPALVSKNIQDIQNITKIPVLKTAVDIAEETENICEEAISVSLYLDSEKRTSAADAALEFVAIWALPTNSADKAKFTIGFGTGLLNVQNKLTKLAGKKLPIVSDLMNFSSSIDLYKRVSTEQKIDAQHKEAYKIFRDSKNMTLEDIDKYEQMFQTKLETLKGLVKTSDDKYLKQLEYSTALLEEKIDLSLHGKGLVDTLDSMDKVDALLRRFARNQEGIKKEYEEEKSKNIAQYTELLMYKNVLTEYRKPLKKSGCEKFLEERQKHCGSRGFKLEQG